MNTKQINQNMYRQAVMKKCCAKRPKPSSVVTGARPVSHLTPNVAMQHYVVYEQL